jgi:hypothetical protein
MVRKELSGIQERLRTIEKHLDASLEKIQNLSREHSNKATASAETHIEPAASFLILSAVTGILLISAVIFFSTRKVLLSIREMIHVWKNLREATPLCGFNRRGKGRFPIWATASTPSWISTTRNNQWILSYQSEMEHK